MAARRDPGLTPETSTSRPGAGLRRGRRGRRCDFCLASGGAPAAVGPVAVGPVGPVAVGPGAAAWFGRQASEGLVTVARPPHGAPFTAEEVEHNHGLTYIGGWAGRTRAG